MEKRSLMTQLLRYLTISPYEWSYTWRLPFYLFFPSERDVLQLPRLPAKWIDNERHCATTNLVIAGDLMLLKGHKIPQACHEMANIINSADYFLTNCEAPIAEVDLDPKAAGFMTFTMPLQYLAGIFSQFKIASDRCIVSVANNHSRDVIEEEFIEGINLVEQSLGIHTVGRYCSESLPFKQFNAPNGLRFAVSSWTHLMNGENFLEKRRVVNRAKNIQSVDWQSIKSDYEIDCLIGLPHWSKEYQHIPGLVTYQQATDFFGQGFDLLLGSHSHVMQSSAWIENKLCSFSLGNFCSVDFHWRTKLVPLLELELDSAGKLVGYQYHFFFQIEKANEVRLEPISELPEALQCKVKRLLGRMFA